MSEVNMTVQLEHDVYVELLTAANEAGLGVSEFAAGAIANYVRDNYGEV